MGDIADFYLDDMDPSSEDFYWESNARCKYCGADHLYWEKLFTGWYLFTKTGRIHKCSRRKK